MAAAIHVHYETSQLDPATAAQAEAVHRTVEMILQEHERETEDEDCE